MIWAPREVLKPLPRGMYFQHVTDSQYILLIINFVISFNSNHLIS